MTQSTTNTSKQFFTGSSVDTILFQRPVNNLLLTTSGTVGLSFDSGGNFMTMTAGTYQFLNMNFLRLDFNGSGSWSGWGIAL